MPSQTSPRYVTYCGLYCGLCAQHSRIPKQASQLKQTLQEEGLSDFYQNVPEMKGAYTQFWQFLQNLTTFDCSCRSGKGGSPHCKIRKCAQGKNIDTCPECKEYPCMQIQVLAERYPNLVQDGKRLQKIGLEKWIGEQEERVRRGVVYSDLKPKRG